MAFRNASLAIRRRPVWVKTRPFVSRSHGSFRQLRTCRNVERWTALVADTDYPAQWLAFNSQTWYFARTGKPLKLAQELL
jgi:hypothetical protein